jgi:hypothetical protein
MKPRSNAPLGPVLVLGYGEFGRAPARMCVEADLDSFRTIALVRSAQENG